MEQASRHAGRRKILCSPADWPARVSNVESRDILPRRIPPIYYLRSPGAVNILRSAAALYMSLRRCGCPAARSYIGSGPTYYALWLASTLTTRAVTLDHLDQARLSQSLGAIVTGRIVGGPNLSLGQVFRDVVAKSNAEFAASRNPSGAPPPESAFSTRTRRVVAAVGPRDPNDPYGPNLPRPYPALPTGMSPEYRGDRLAHAGYLISAQIDSISPTDRVHDRVAHLEDAGRAMCRRFQINHYGRSFRPFPKNYQETTASSSNRGLRSHSPGQGMAPRLQSNRG